jgi:hypothetical protein
MANFPTLKTGAVAQYPATVTLRHRNQTVRFVDGVEQRYRDSARPLRRWLLMVDQLDESEASAVEKFLAENQGAFANFGFTDPWTGVHFPNCSIEDDALDISFSGEMHGSTLVTIVENRA